MRGKFWTGPEQEEALQCGLSICTELCAGAATGRNALPRDWVFRASPASLVVAHLKEAGGPETCCSRAGNMLAVSPTCATGLAVEVKAQHFQREQKPRVNSRDMSGGAHTSSQAPVPQAPGAGTPAPSPPTGTHCRPDPRSQQAPLLSRRPTEHPTGCRAKSRCRKAAHQAGWPGRAAPHNGPAEGQPHAVTAARLPADEAQPPLACTAAEPAFAEPPGSPGLWQTDATQAPVNQR